jgi:16S rRNA (cytidine1402-2'-O)-methyltransferase
MGSPASVLMLQAAAAAAGGQQYPAATLFVVATPIGNLADLSLRAIHVLSLVDAVACEDTRHSAPLLRHLGLEKPLLALHEHNEHQAAQAVLARLALGQRVAYISDAGTPAISDPGAVLVAQAQQAGYRCIPIPGASSALAAVSVAGDEKGQDLIFKGFLPPRGNERLQALKAVMACPDTQIVFEAPHRIESLLDGLTELGEQRTVTVCRELTKQFETVVTLPAHQLTKWLKLDPNHARGEFVLVVHALARSNTDHDDAEHDPTLKALLAELPLKQAVSLAATLTGAARNALYARALQLKAQLRP